MPYESLRAYLEVLEQRGLLHWIDKEVDKDSEIAAIGRMMFLALPEEQRFGLGFRNIKGYPGGRVVSGVIAASTQMIATALKCDPVPTEIYERLMHGINHPIEAVMVDSGPCKEVILGPKEVNLLSFPIPVWTPTKDAGPYLTPMWVTKDPDTGVRDIGIRRCQIKGRNKTGVLFGAPDRYGAIHHAKWKLRGKAMPAALFIGADPVQYLVAPSRFGIDELAVAGGIRGKAVELVKCETVDLEVPATAEIVVEGEILTDALESEGPFGEFTGYVAGERLGPVFCAKCVTHRKDPIVLGLISQFPPSESSMIKRNLLEASMLKHLRQNLSIPGIVDLHAIEASGCTAMLWVSLKKMYTGHVDQLVFGVLGYMGMSYFKWIVVTDENVDIRDPFMRDWALSWHVRPDKDMRFISDTAATELDPSSLPPDAVPGDLRGTKVIIDATKKWKYPDISLPPREYLERVVAKWTDYGLPPLGKVKLPKAI
ncbi:MAG: UbiD family decarboxylase [Acidobacteria bacterium]|nr:UbiD family decarboxylase [Acidobacteriota bacterium]